MRRWKYLIPFLLIAMSAALLVSGVIGFKNIFTDRLYDERKQQLSELTSQISDTFSNAVKFNWTRTETAERMFLENAPATSSDVSAAAKRIGNILDVSESDGILMFLDRDGNCYDAQGERGIWGDFDQVTGIEGYYTFIADSVTYNGIHWAFTKKFEAPVAISDGMPIEYVVILRTIESLNGYYTSKAYADSSETYILRENGVRMYDDVDPSDTISSYNIYKALREGEGEEPFDDILATLKNDGIACGVYTDDDGKEYCYSLSWLREYEFVIMYLIPTDMVAVNTVMMISAITKALIITALLFIMLIGATVYAVMRLNNSRKLFIQKEQNLREMERVNTKLEETNVSLMSANKAAESALDIARSANKAKSSFLSNMSHDIRTPLNAIIGFLTLLDRDADDPEKVRKYSEKIAVSSHHLLNLINDILDMSRIESGKTTLNMHKFSVGDLIGEISTIFTPQAQQKRLQLTIDDGGASGLTVVGDKLRIEQILINLMSNAVKYTPEGGEVRFIVRKQEKHTRRVVMLRFIVRDTGVGMSEEFQKRVFEPFEREQSELSTSTQGTGLGMAIAKNLADLMGGIIMLDSILGKGSVFTLELTLELADGGGAVGTEPESEETTTEDDKVLEGKRFLVAEDNEINAEIIGELLDMEGASCDIAKNGKEAVRMFTESESGYYDAIFMDIQMPVMNGYDAARAIRAASHPDAETIPMAAMTANAFSEDVQKALESGMSAHIAKPIDMRKVKEFIAGETAVEAAIEAESE